MTPKKLPQATQEILSDRLYDEQYANRFYRYVSNCLGNIGFVIAQKYYANEAAQEIEHAKGLEEYAVNWNCELDFRELPEMPEIEGVYDIVDASYNRELKLLQSYSEDCEKVLKAGDMSTFFFLQKYVQIQTDSVAEIATTLNQLALFDKSQLFINEKKLFKIK